MTMIHAQDGVTTYRGWFQSPLGIPIAPDNDWYGVEWNTDTAFVYPDCTRIGNPVLHQTLPVQSQMYGCLLNDDGSENYKLHPTNWAFREDGVTPSVLDGSEGQVMVRLPGFYFGHEVDGSIRRWKISTAPVSGFEYEPPQYVSAYEAALNRSTSTLASVVNTTPDYRGGNNTAAWDGTHRDLLGRPATNISRTNFRIQARNRGAGWEMYNYWAHRAIVILVTIEYATRNSQLAFTTQKDIFGMSQGALGSGCTNLDSTLWNSWNSRNPFLPCGHTNHLGNLSGESFDYPAYESGGSGTRGNRYRGIENPFGHIWKNCDGVNLRNGDANAFVSRDRSRWQDDDYQNMENIGEYPTANGFIRQMMPGQILPTLVGGSSDSFWCDSFSRSNGAVLRTVLFCGTASTGADAGLVLSNSLNAPSATATLIGSRLCYFPAS